MAVEVASMFARIGADLSGLTSGLGQADNMLKNAGRNMSRVGKTLTAGVTLPIVGIGGAAVKMAGEFEQQMGLLQIAAKASGDDMQAIEQYALKMGAKTIYNAREMAEAMTGLYKAGMSSAEVIGDATGKTGALAAATQLATASDLELAASADAIAVAMATFGLSTDQAVGITNNFVQTADASVAEVSDLVLALQNAGPTAAQFGWSLEDVNTAMAILSERGIRGSEAGTALKSMMTNLMRPTKDVRATLADLNVDLYDAEGTLKTLPQIIGNLADALYGESTAIAYVGGKTQEQSDELERLGKLHDKTAQQIRDYESGIKGLNLTEEKRGKKLGELYTQLGNIEGAMQPLVDIKGKAVSVTRTLTEAERNEAIQTLAGTYGMKAMASLLTEGVAGWEAMEGAVSEAATAQDVADVKINSLSGVLEQLSGSLETAAIKIGELLIPHVKDLVKNHIMPLIDRIAELDPEVLKLGLTIAGVAAAAGPALVVLGSLATVLGALLSPIGLVVLAVAGLGVAYATNFLGIKDVVDAAIPKIVAFGQATWEWINEKAIPAVQGLLSKIDWQAIYDWFATNIPRAMEALSEFWEGTLRPAIEAVVLWFGENVPLAMAAISNFWEETLLPAWEAISQYANEHLVPLLEALSNLFAAIGEVGMIVLAGIWDNTLKPALSDAWTWLSEKLGPAIEDVSKFLGDLASLIGETVGPVISSFKEETVKAAADAFDILAGAIDSAVEWLNKAADAVRKLPASLPGWITGHSPSPFEKSLWGIADAAKAAVGALRPLDAMRMGGGGFGGMVPAMAGGGARQTVILPVLVADRRDFETMGGELDIRALAEWTMRVERRIGD